VHELEIRLAAEAVRQRTPAAILVENDHQLDAERETRDAGEHESPAGTIGQCNESDDRGPRGDQQTCHDASGDLLAAPSSRAAAMIPDPVRDDQKFQPC
jgi:hypothetical protein